MKRFIRITTRVYLIDYVRLREFPAPALSCGLNSLCFAWTAEFAEHSVSWVAAVVAAAPALAALVDPAVAAVAAVVAGPVDSDPDFGPDSPAPAS